jgi:hypothetical protein
VISQQFITPKGVTLNSLHTSKNLVFNVLAYFGKTAAVAIQSSLYVALSGLEINLPVHPRRCLGLLNFALSGLIKAIHFPNSRYNNTNKTLNLYRLKKF